MGQRSWKGQTKEGGGFVLVESILNEIVTSELGIEWNYETRKVSPTYCQSTLAVSLIEKQGGVLAAVTADVH